MEEEQVVVTHSLGDGSNDTVVVPATPESVHADNDENVPPTTASEVRKSGRARKPKKIEQVPTEEKPKRKYTKRKSLVPEEGVVVPDSEPPKKRKKSLVVSVQAPTVSAPVIESADADAPPIMITAESFVLPPEPKQPKKKKDKWIPSDVPPIAGLPRRYDPHAKKARKVKKQGEAEEDKPIEQLTVETEVVVVEQPIIVEKETPVIESGDADAPPPAPYDPSIDAPPVVEEKVQTSTPGQKKLTQIEIAMKNQPSVLKFFTSNKQSTEASPEDKEASRSPMRDIVRPVSPMGVVPEPPVARPAPETPDFTLYQSLWRLSRRTYSKSNRRFFVRDATNIRYLGPSEIGPKKTTVYAGENPVHRIRLRRIRPVYIAIHDRERPPVRMLIAHASTGVSGRHPLGADPIIDYDRDSDEEWAEENDGEDLNSNADDEEEEEEVAVDTGDQEDAQSENSFFVSDGHFSEDEALSDDEAMVARRRRNEMSIDSEGKSTLQLIVFTPADLETRNTDYSHEPNHDKWFKLLWDEATVKVYDESHFFAEPVVAVVEKVKPQKVEKPPKPEKPVVDRSELAKFVHGKIVNIDSLISDFRAQYPDLSANALKTEIRSIASWTKKPELMPRIAWFVKPELFNELSVSEEEMLALITERMPAAPAPTTKIVTTSSVLPFKPVVDEQPVEQRANIHN